MLPGKRCKSHGITPANPSARNVPSMRAILCQAQKKWDRRFRLSHPVFRREPEKERASRSNRDALKSNRRAGEAQREGVRR